MSDDTDDETAILARAYLAGRNAAANNRIRLAPDYSTELQALNWLCGYDEFYTESFDQRSSLDR